MNLVHWLLMFNFIFLSILPCKEGAEDSCGSIIEHEVNHTDNDDSSSEDSCTPFCICNCCNSILTSSQVLLSFSMEEFWIDKNQSTITRDLQIFNLSYSFCQPPKIAFL